MSRPQVRAGGRSTPVVVVSPRLRSNQEEAEGTLFLNERDILGIWGKERAGWAEPEGGHVGGVIRMQRYLLVGIREVFGKRPLDPSRLAGTG